MKPSILAIALLTGLIASAAISAAGAELHDHQQEAAPAGLHLDQGRKWATDAPLREGMAAIHSELAARLPAIRKGRLSNGDYAALGKAIDNAVVNIVSQCKLEPKADAMLHIILADLLAASEAMRGPVAEGRDAAAHKAVTALNNYGIYFDHPQWQALK